MPRPESATLSVAYLPGVIPSTDRASTEALPTLICTLPRSGIASQALVTRLSSARSTSTRLTRTRSSAPARSIARAIGRPASELPDHVGGLGHDRVEVDRRVFLGLGAGERQQLMHQRLGPLTGSRQSRGDGLEHRVGAGLAPFDVGPGRDDRQDVVEVVGNARGEPPQRFHLLRPAEPVLQLLVADDAGHQVCSRPEEALLACVAGVPFLEGDVQHAQLLRARPDRDAVVAMRGQAGEVALVTHVGLAREAGVAAVHPTAAHAAAERYPRERLQLVELETPARAQLQRRRQVVHQEHRSARLDPEPAHGEQVIEHPPELLVEGDGLDPDGQEPSRICRSRWSLSRSSSARFHWLTSWMRCRKTGSPLGVSTRVG